jgi:hypothetical protein
VAVGFFVESLDHMAPSCVLTVVDLAKVQHIPLHHPAASTTPALHNTPVTVFLPVLKSSVASQIHSD